jgi:hypothetical protein
LIYLGIRNFSISFALYLSFSLYSHALFCLCIKSKVCPGTDHEGGGTE